MSSKTLFIVILFLLVGNGICDNGFNEKFSVTEGKLAYCSNILGMPDSSTFLICDTNAFVQPSNYDGWLVKLKPDGTVSWTVMFGTLGSNYNPSLTGNVALDGEENIITVLYGHQWSLSITKLSGSDGSILWSKNVETPGTGKFRGIVCDKETGNFIIFLSSTNLVVLVQFNSSGSFQKSDYLGLDTFVENPVRVAPTKNGDGFLLSTLTTLSNRSESYLLDFAISRWDFDFNRLFYFYFGNGISYNQDRTGFAKETENGDIVHVRSYWVNIDSHEFFCIEASLFDVSFDSLNIKFSKRYCDTNAEYNPTYSETLVVTDFVEVGDFFALVGRYSKLPDDDFGGPMVFLISKFTGEFISLRYVSDNLGDVVTFLTASTHNGETENGQLVTVSAHINCLGPVNQCNDFQVLKFGSRDNLDNCNLAEEPKSHIVEYNITSTNWKMLELELLNYESFNFTTGDSEFVVSHRPFPLLDPDFQISIPCVNCFGVSSESSGVCHGHGVCEKWDECDCLSIYPGIECEKWSCFGIAHDDIKNVCGNNHTRNGNLDVLGGTCIVMDTCTCFGGYYSNIPGRECTEWDCGKYNAKESEKVCSGRGSCISPQNCQCFDDYEGNYCESWSCGEDYRQESTCSGRGKCVAPDTCDCKGGYGGSRCQKNLMYLYVMTPILSVVFCMIVLAVMIFLSICLFCCFCCCFVLLVLSCSTLGISAVNLAQKRRISEFNKLEDFEVLLQEQLLEKDTTIAHLRINKRLFEIPFEEVKVEQMIGEGGSDAKVFLATWKGVKVAFKCFRTRNLLSDQSKFDSFEAEVGLLINISHPNIIRFFGASLKPPRVGFVMEYCENGELLQFCKRYRKEKNGRGYRMSEKIRICREIIAACEFIHSRNIIHRDIKPENILLDSSEVAKLMDFGVSRFIEESNSNLTTTVGTSLYMAPEIMKGVYDEKVDSFSFAILLWVFFSENEKPYGEGTFKIELSVANNPNFRPKLKDFERFLGKNKRYNWIIEVIRTCWNHNPADRYSFTELAQVFEKEMIIENNKRSSEKVFLDAGNEEKMEFKRNPELKGKLLEEIKRLESLGVRDLEILGKLVDDNL